MAESIKWVNYAAAEYILAKHQEEATNRQYRKGLRDAMKVLAKMATADAPVICGRWIETSPVSVECPVCGAVTILQEGSVPSFVEQTPFCDRCGARLEGSIKREA